jgi:hypothetical protein
MLIDSTFDTSGGATYTLTEIHHTDTGHTLRVRVRRDFYRHQSHAAADVLTPDLTWTTLAATPAPDWHPATPHRDATPAALQPIADALTARARRILANTPTPTRAGSRPAGQPA